MSKDERKSQKDSKNDLMERGDEYGEKKRG